MRATRPCGSWPSTATAPWCPCFHCPRSRSQRSRPLSSTTERPNERGQILVLFAGAAVALLIVAAIAFDVGSMYLERRDQQNAADAAALAGARYVNGAADFHGNCAA